MNSVTALQRSEDAYHQALIEAPRVARLGAWPAWIAPETLALRIPTSANPGAGGFDAGVACALGLIPPARQRLAATLHAAYTPAAVEQVRQETDGTLDPDADSTWWLAACSVCEEEDTSPERFAAQLDRFEALRLDPALRVGAAQKALEEMYASYAVRQFDTCSAPVATRDGGMQGAYLAGHEFAAAHDEANGLWFLGTFRASLGLEGFTWRKPGNPGGATLDERLGRSGPVHGSTQFVKCCDEDEFALALHAMQLRG